MEGHGGGKSSSTSRVITSLSKRCTVMSGADTVLAVPGILHSVGSGAGPSPACVTTPSTSHQQNKNTKGIQ